jgi:DNA-binding MarR family transcriptional regulator
LRTSGPLTATQLARSIELTSGGLSIALDRLERLGYIRGSQHPDDRRSLLIEATEILAPLDAELFGRSPSGHKLLRTYTREKRLTIRHKLERAAEVTNAAARPRA